MTNDDNLVSDAELDAFLDAAESELDAALGLALNIKAGLAEIVASAAKTPGGRSAVCAGCGAPGYAARLNVPPCPGAMAECLGVRVLGVVAGRRVVLCTLIM
jgi:hypothetical protein